jgi:hypothetical protein
MLEIARQESTTGRPQLVVHITITTMEEEKRNVNSGGRGITIYIPEYDEQAYNYCLLGATNETLAEFFGVCPATIKKWMKKYPSFGESVKRGKLMADMNVAASLYKRAIGYTYQQVVSESVQISATQTESEKVANPVATFLPEDMEDMRIVRVTTREAIPDVRAQIFWLKNRQPELWRDKQEVDHKSGGENMGYVTIFELPNDGRNP